MKSHPCLLLQGRKSTYRWLVYMPYACTHMHRLTIVYRSMLVTESVQGPGSAPRLTTNPTSTPVATPVPRFSIGDTAHQLQSHRQGMCMYIECLHTSTSLRSVHISMRLYKLTETDTTIQVGYGREDTDTGNLKGGTPTASETEKPVRFPGCCV